MFLGKTAQSPSVFSHATRSTAEAHIYRSLAAVPSLETPSSSDRLAFHFLGKQYEHGWKWMNLYEHVWTCMNVFEHVWTSWLMRTKMNQGKQQTVSHIWTSWDAGGAPASTLCAISSVAWLPDVAMVGGWGVQGCPNGCPIQICRMVGF